MSTSASLSGAAYSRTAAAGLLAERVVALDERDERRAGDRGDGGAGVERPHELLVAAAGDRRLRGEQADAPVAGGLDGGVRLRLEDADDRHRQLLLELRERRRGGGVARSDDELHALPLEEARDLVGKAADLVGRARPVRQPRAVADVDEVLVRERDETLVEDGQPAHAGVEHAERSPIHQSIVRAGRYPSRAVRRTLPLLVAVAALAWPGVAAAWTKQDVTIPASDGLPLAATLYVPDGAAPSGGWPAIMLLHGLGGSRQGMNTLAEQYFLPGEQYAVLTVDARGHGATGGLVTIDGPREVADVRDAFGWLAARPDVADDRIGAWGISYGGGAVWNALVGGVPFAAAETCETWTDLYSALVPQNLSKSGRRHRLPLRDPTGSARTGARDLPGVGAHVVQPARASIAV